MQSAPIIGVVTCLHTSCLSQMRGVKRRGSEGGVYVCIYVSWPTLCERAGIQHRVTGSAEFSGWKTRRVEFVCWLEECAFEGLDFAIRALILGFEGGAIFAPGRFVRLEEGIAFRSFFLPSLSPFQVGIIVYPFFDSQTFICCWGV